MIRIVLVAVDLRSVKIEVTPVFRAAEKQQSTQNPLREALVQAPRRSDSRPGRLRWCSHCFLYRNYLPH